MSGPETNFKLNKQETPKCAIKKFYSHNFLLRSIIQTLYVRSGGGAEKDLHCACLISFSSCFPNKLSSFLHATSPLTLFFVHLPVLSISPVFPIFLDGGCTSVCYNWGPPTWSYFYVSVSSVSVCLLAGLTFPTSDLYRRSAVSFHIFYCD